MKNSQIGSTEPQNWHKSKYAFCVLTFLAATTFAAFYYYYPKLSAWHLSLENKKEITWGQNTVEIYWTDYTSDSLQYKEHNISSYAEIYVWTSDFTYVSQQHSIKEHGVSIRGIKVEPYEKTTGIKIYWIRLGRNSISQSRIIYFDNNNELVWTDDP